MFKGIPWLWRRGRDLVPYAAGILVRSWLAEEPVPVRLEPETVRPAA